MADKDLPTGTTEGATGTTDDKSADGSATTTADGSGGAETIEQLRARLQETERKNAQLLSEKSGVEELRKELQNQRVQPNAPPAGEDPYATQMGRLQQIVARYGVDSFEGQTAIAQGYALESSRRAEYKQDFLIQVERDLLKVPSERRDEVKGRILNGEFSTVAQADEAVQGAKSGSTIEQLRKEVAELRANAGGGRQAPRVVDVSTGVRSQAPAAHGTKTISLGDYERTTSDPHSRQARELFEAIDSGDTVIDYGA